MRPTDLGEPHVCACRECDPTLAPTGERQGEHHAAVRLTAADALCDVFKDGEKINDCVEVLAGSPGRAWRFRQPTHRCLACLREVCEYVDEGNFSFRRVAFR